MVLCGHRKSHQEDQVKVNIGTTVLKKQTSVKYLGVTVDNHLRSVKEKDICQVPRGHSEQSSALACPH